MEGKPIKKDKLSVHIFKTRTEMGRVAEWAKSGGKIIDAPTHFEVSEGEY